MGFKKPSLLFLTLQLHKEKWKSLKESYFLTIFVNKLCSESKLASKYTTTVHFAWSIPQSMWHATFWSMLNALEIKWCSNLFENSFSPKSEFRKLRKVSAQNWMQQSLHISPFKQHWDALQVTFSQKGAIKYHLLYQKTWVFNCFRRNLAPKKVLAVENFGPGESRPYQWYWALSKWFLLMRLEKIGVKVNQRSGLVTNLFQHYHNFPLLFFVKNWLKKLLQKISLLAATVEGKPSISTKFLAFPRLL